MEMNNIVTLLEVHTGMGHNPTETVGTSRIVWAYIQQPSTSLKIDAEKVGIKADLIIHMWRREFDTANFNYAEIDRIRYKIAATGSSVNDNYVKLTVTRC